MHSVTYHVDGGMQASRPMLLARVPLIPIILLMQLAFGLWQLVLWLWHLLLLLLRRERDTHAWESARRAVEFCSSQSAFLLLLSDRWPAGAVRVRLDYSPLVSRLELLIRPFFSILLFINAAVFAILFSPFWVLQFLNILVFARRHPGLQRLLLGYLGFLTDARAYALMGVEERPPLFPSNLGWLLAGLRPPLQRQRH